MKTILILANSSGGLYDFRNELVLELRKHYKVAASLPDSVKTDLLEKEGVEVIKTPVNRRGVNPFEDLKLLETYKDLIRRYQPALVLTYTIKPNIYGGMACAALGVPYIATITGLGSAFEKKGLFLSMIEIMYRRGLRKADCVFFQNQENLNLFRQYSLVTGKSRLVSGSGVSLAAHPFMEYPEGNDTYFLYVGRMMREKGIGELLTAARRLSGERVHFGLMGYCDEDWQEKLDEAQQQGFIDQLGFHTEVNEYYKKASAVVMPTYLEGMSNVLMEASACGRPVIASNISGCREIFEDGVTGIGFAPKSADSLTDALKKFLALDRGQRAAMGQAAHDKMAREFDRTKVTAAYMQEIEKAVLTK